MKTVLSLITVAAMLFSIFSVHAVADSTQRGHEAGHAVDGNLEISVRKTCMMQQPSLYG